MIIIIIININIIISFTPGFSDSVTPSVSEDIFRNQDRNTWYVDGVELIEKNLKVKENRNTAKSAVLFVGDGMGITTITAARIYDGQLKGQYGEENVLSWETFLGQLWLRRTMLINKEQTLQALLRPSYVV